MKQSIKLVSGYHITAHDKRSIVQGIEWLRAEFAPYVKAAPRITPDYASQWISRAGSPKRYSIKPLDADLYLVTIRTNEKTDFGRKQTRESHLTIETRGIAPLHMALTPNNTAYRTELTPTGEQTVIPGFEMDAMPTARQLNLF